MKNRIKRILNNNAVLVSNELGTEAIFIGKGIAYGASKGDVISPNKVSKTFYLSKTHKEKFTELVEEFTLEEILLAGEAVTLIRELSEQENKKLSDSIYITLTDHIATMIDRLRKGYDFDYISLLNIKRLYPSEFKIAEQVVDLLSSKLQVEIPNAEANFITLHIVNAQEDTNMVRVYKITNFINEILAIVETFFPEAKKDTLSYDRFITHCRFLVNRILDDHKNNRIEVGDTKAYGMVSELYVQQKECVEKIGEHVEQKYKVCLGDDEKMFLMLHLTKLTLQ